MGWSGLAMTLAMAFGPMFGLWLIQDQSYHSLFLTGVIFSMISLFLTFGAKNPFKPKKTDKIKRIQIFEKSIVLVTVSVFLLFIAYGGITSFVPL